MEYSAQNPWMGLDNFQEIIDISEIIELSKQHGLRQKIGNFTANKWLRRCPIGIPTVMILGTSYYGLGKMLWVVGEAAHNHPHVSIPAGVGTLAVVSCIAFVQERDAMRQSQQGQSANINQVQDILTPEANEELPIQQIGVNDWLAN